MCLSEIIGADKASSSLLWPISNKYYSSRVKFLPFYDLDEAVRQGPGCPAVLVLVGKGKVSSLAFLRFYR